MESKGLSTVWIILAICLVSSPLPSSSSVFNRSASKHRGYLLPGIELHDLLGLNTVTSSPSNSECSQPKDQEEDVEPSTWSRPLKLPLQHRISPTDENKPKVDLVRESAHKDKSRIHSFSRRIAEKKNLEAASRLSHSRALQEAASPPSSSVILATLESGVSQGSGEYFMDVFVGSPPRHFSLILDTGSDLNWIQCVPCHDCFEQTGPYYDPSLSSSYRNVTCADPRCHLVSSPDPPQPCRSPDQPCPYFYWYGDRSNTTGDLALETFTVNLTAATGEQRVNDIVFGCGHWNRGLFHGAAGLLGMGRGPLSFTSQLRSIYGHIFSYCLVDRNSDASISSKLIFGEDKSLTSHRELNYTSFVAGKDNPADTFYYVKVKGIMVGGELLEIPPETWELSSDGGGGTIIDSGTTLSYFAEPAYKAIKEAFLKKVGDRLPVVEDFPVLELCYNVSGVERAVEFPEFAILFGDGAMWRFPTENYFIRLEQEEVMCLAILGIPRTSFSILGNYQQQNFHIMYDIKNSRLGFAPMDCSQL